MRHSKQIAVTLTLLLLAGAAGWAGWVNARHESTLPGVIAANGRIEAERIEIAAKYPGRILSLPVREGELVTAGALIATQETDDLDAQRAAAVSARGRASAAIARASAETAAHLAQARLAQLELDHAGALRQQALVSQAEVERRTAQRDGEAAGVTALRAAVAEAGAARAEADAQIRRLDVALADLRLLAPVAGRIEYRIASPGAVLPSGGRVATLLDLSEIYMTVFLPTAGAAGLRVGDEARIVLDAQPFVLPASVSFIAAEAQFTPKYVETASERDKLMYRVKLKLAAPAARRYAAWVRPGLTGNGYVRSSPGAAWPAQLAVHLPRDGRE